MLPSKENLGFARCRWKEGSAMATSLSLPCSHFLHAPEAVPVPCRIYWH
jgi:hypothetical protein